MLMDLLISCMDYRLSKYLEYKADLIIRNAGGLVNDIIEKINLLKPDRILYMPHRDCAAMKLAKRILNNEIAVNNDIYNYLAATFKNAENLEEYNYEYGLSMLKKNFNNVTGELIDTKSIDWPERKPYYKILNSYDKYNNLNGYYIIQAPDISWIEKDIKIAEILGLTRLK